MKKPEVENLVSYSLKIIVSVYVLLPARKKIAQIILSMFRVVTGELCDSVINIIQ
jgi:hypothetical protein